MVAITRKEIAELKDARIFSTTKTVDAKSVGYFLNLFEDGQPLQREAVLEWQDLPPNGLQADFIKKCFEQALKQGLIEDRDDEFHITRSGKEQAEDAAPEGPYIG